MNCSQVNELLPLYAGHDLGKSREQLVAAHLQTCVACSLAEAEYRDVRRLMSDFASPVFGDEDYAGMRKNVWQQIESEPRRQSLFESIAVWLQPQFAWAAAAVLMITAAFAGLYFINKEFRVQPAGIVDIPRIVVPSLGPSPETHGGAPLIPGEGEANKRQANTPKRQRRPDRMVAPDRGSPLVAYSPDAKTGAQPSRLPSQASETLALQSESAVIGTDNPGAADRDSEKTLRMEIQTQNPNIRIIWFSQR